MVYGLDQQRGKGEGKGAEENKLPNAYVEYAGDCADTCVFSAFGYGAVKESGGQNRTLSPSVPLTRTAAKNRGHTRRQKQAGEASWLK